MRKNIATTYHQLMRWQHGLNRRLRRGGLVAVLLVFSIGVFGPLACIIHCALIDALHPQAVYAHHADPASGTHPARSSAAVASHTQEAIGRAPCHLADDTGNPAHAPLAKAMYELALVLIIALAPPVIRPRIGVYYAADRLVWRPGRPPLRPPRFA
ncbi:MAG: hypothetical protein H7Z42_05635 [Roseiflexaceae bacterium]|nr:hypothetical protein [Roseiflexaceae bacterium]